MSVEDHPRKVALLVCLVSLLIFLLLPRWRYGDVSDLTYEIGSALYSSCNRQDESRLPSIAEKIDAASQDNQLTAQETGWLEEILHLAEEGNWEQARQKARHLMQDQVRFP